MRSDGANYDFLIIGGGVAGLRAAVGLAARGRALVLTKSDPTESNTGYAQGGVAAAVGSDDSAALHAEDTIRAGDGLCDESAVRVLVEHGAQAVHDLIDWGARFDRSADGSLALAREAAHSVRRVLHAGDATGREIGRVLWDRVAALPSVTTIDHAFVTDLIVEDGVARGVAYVDRNGVRQGVRAHATLLATGGAGQVFSDTTNPPVATGDGIALAYRAGARVADLEFVQFHPTALNKPGAPRFLISEALRGEGARLVNAQGQPFMAAQHPDGDLAPRDVVARGIAFEMQRTGRPVFLTLAHLDAGLVRRRFPTIAAMCATVGLDLARDPIPVGPAAHYIMGGVVTDEWARTSVPGLYAAGEVACTGLHGANRLASNSLLEGLVFGARAVEAMPQKAAAGSLKSGFTDRRPGTDERPATDQAPGIGREGPTRDDIRALMWREVGVSRTGHGLAFALLELDRALACDYPATPDGWRLRNLATVAWLIGRAAFRRVESRGAHYRADAPAKDDLHWKVHLVDQHHG